MNTSGATITLTQGEINITESVTIDASMLDSGLTSDAGGATHGSIINDKGFVYCDH